MRPIGLLAIAAALLAAGCAKRDMPYRFRAPLVDGIAAPDVPRRRLLPTRALPRVDPVPATPIPPKAGPKAAALYGFVGQRNSEDHHVEFALRALDAIEVRVPAALRAAADGPALVEAARARDALSTSPPLLGDLVVFDDLQGLGPSCLVGVVVSSRKDGTAEFVYLAMGVVRRGYLNRARPTDKRDRDGRVLNTWLRAKRGHYSKGLAGDAFATYIRLDRLL
jgi:hypothetical protein